MNPWLAAATPGISMVIALAIGIQSAPAGYYLSVATLGPESSCIAFIEMASLTGGPSGWSKIPELSLFGMPRDLRYYFLVWLVSGVTLVGPSASWTRLGRACAIGADETAAALSGINTWATKVQIFRVATASPRSLGSLYATTSRSSARMASTSCSRLS
jgi:ABC-type branched-subunit amino acid transport system permease subunit